MIYCDVCHQDKQTRLLFSEIITTITTSHLFTLIHCDMWGPYRTCTHGKCKMFLTIIENYSKCIWVFLLPDKTQVAATIQNFITFVQTQFHTIVQILRSDIGTEFLNHDLTSFLNSLGIIYQTSCPHTPQKNGVVERKHLHLLNVTRSLKYNLLSLIPFRVTAY